MSFDTLARHYRWMERVLAGEKLQRARTEFLGKMCAPKRALLVGEGNGRFLKEFTARFPNAKTTCLDSSEKMLAAAKQSVAGAGSVTFLRADIFEWKAPTAQFDLIVTNFFLDCFTRDQIAGVVNKLAAAATSEATWLLSDFSEPPRGWRKWRARWILTSMHLFFRFATKLPARRLTPPDEFLTGAAFELRERKFYDWDLLHADWWQRKG